MTPFDPDYTIEVVAYSCSHGCQHIALLRDGDTVIRFSPAEAVDFVTYARSTATSPAQREAMDPMLDMIMRAVQASNAFGIDVG